DLKENADKYFERAKKSMKELDNIRKRTPILIKKKEKIELFLIKLKEINKIKELKKLPEKIKSEIGFNVKIDENIEKEKSSFKIADKFRKFILEEGFILYVGRDSKNNDELTMRFAKP